MAAEGLVQMHQGEGMTGVVIAIGSTNNAKLYM